MNIVPGGAPFFDTIDHELIPHGFQTRSQFQGHRILAETRVTVVDTVRNWIVVEFQFSSLGVYHNVNGFQQHAQIEGGFCPTPTAALGQLARVLDQESKPFDNFVNGTDGRLHIGVTNPEMQAHLVQHFQMFQPGPVDDMDEDLADEAMMNEDFAPNV